MEGVRFLWAQRRLRTIALLSTAINLLDGPLILAVIVLARDDLHADARTIGLIFSVAGGELLGSFLAPWVKARVRMGRVLIGAVAVWALAMPLEAAAMSPPMLIAGAALADMMIPIYNVTRVSYRLSLIPDALQGRVNSAYRLPSAGLAHPDAARLPAAAGVLHLRYEPFSLGRASRSGGIGTMGRVPVRGAAPTRLWPPRGQGARRSGGAAGVGEHAGHRVQDLVQSERLGHEGGVAAPVGG